MRTEDPKNVERAGAVLKQMKQGKTLRSACASIRATEVTMRVVINRHPELRREFETTSKANGKAPHLVTKLAA